MRPVVTSFSSVGYDNEPLNTMIIVVDDRHIRFAKDLSAADPKERLSNLLIRRAASARRYLDDPLC